MYYILFYKTVDHYKEKRKPYRADHLAMAKEAYEKGDLVMGGALDDPADEAVLVFKGESDAAARAFAENDPYVKNGLISAWSVRPWKVVIGE